MSVSLLVRWLFIYSLCAVSQFICHIQTVRYRTVQFSIKSVPGGHCSLVHSNATKFCVILIFKTLITSPSPHTARILRNKRFSMYFLRPPRRSSAGRPHIQYIAYLSLSFKTFRAQNILCHKVLIY